MKPFSLSELKEGQRKSAVAATGAPRREGGGMAEKLQAANDEIERLQAENDKLYHLLRRATTRLMALDTQPEDWTEEPVVIEGERVDG